MATQIGAQCFTLRDYCKTPADVAQTLARLKKMGFGAIQASAGCFGSIDAKELRKMLDDNGLVCAATHRNVEEMKDAQKQIDWHAEVGCKLTAVGGAGFKGMGRSEWEQWARDYNAVAKQYAGSGLQIGYHNHSHEFSPFGLAENPAGISPKNNPQQVLLDTLDKSVWFEIDVFWVQMGGADPAEWISRCKGRIPAIHVKDMTVTPDRQHKMCEVGLGNLNWPRILEAAKAAGVQWYLIERDNGDLDPFQSLEISLKNLHAMGLQ